MTKKRSTQRAKTKRKAPKKGANALIKIVKAAKGLKKKSPGKKWTTYIKEAAAKYRSKKL